MVLLPLARKPCFTPTNKLIALSFFNQQMIQLHRNFGKLHTAQNKLDEALDDLSKDIYCSSLEVGPEHIDTSAGYFLIANIFYAQRKVTQCASMGESASMTFCWV